MPKFNNLKKRVGGKTVTVRGNSQKSVSSNCFSGVLYLEHFKTADDALNYLIDIFACRCAVSPLHDKDIYEKTEVDEKTGEILHEKGQIKKEHYHFIIKFKRTFSEKYIREKIQGFGLAEKCGDESVMCRYFIHIDNKDKAQYLRDDVRIFKYEYDDMFHALDTDKEFLDTIYMICIVNSIVSYSHLLKFCFESDKHFYLLSYLRKHSYFISQFLLNVRNELSCDLDDNKFMQFQAAC